MKFQYSLVAERELNAKMKTSKIMERSRKINEISIGERIVHFSHRSNIRYHNHPFVFFFFNCLIIRSVSLFAVLRYGVVGVSTKRVRATCKYLF